MRYGVLPDLLLAQLRGNWTKPDRKIWFRATLGVISGGRVECEITPTMLWMSSSKRYIWYFTLHYGNLLSKQMPPVEGKYNNRKEIGERRNP